MDSEVVTVAHFCIECHLQLQARDFTHDNILTVLSICKRDYPIRKLEAEDD